MLTALEHHLETMNLHMETAHLFRLLDLQDRHLVLHLALHLALHRVDVEQHVEINLN